MGAACHARGKPERIYAVGERGVTLIETLVGLAVLGLVAVGFLTGVATTTNAVALSDRKTTAESLARGQIESIKGQDYIDFATPGHGEYVLVEVAAGYSLAVTVQPFDPGTLLDLPEGQDQGIQRLTVTVSRNGRTELSIEDYKVER